MTPAEELRQFAERIHLSGEDVAYLLSIMAEAIAAEREACARIAECHTPEPSEAIRDRPPVE